MMGSHIRSLAVPAILIAGNLSLIWLIAPYLNAPENPVPNVDSASAATPGSALPGPIASLRRLAPIASFSATAERPIFLASRRPTKPEKDPETVTVQAPFDLKLQGILFSADARLAVVSNKSGQNTLRLAEGTEHLGWTLAKIEPKAAVFRRNTAERRLVLSYDGRTPAMERTGSPAGGVQYLSPLRAMPKSELAAILSQKR